MRLIAFTVIALWAGVAQAAVIHIKPSLVAVFDPDANYADVLDSAVLSNSDGRVVLRPSTATRIMQIDFSFTISDLQDGQLGFGNAAFNIDLAGGLIESPLAPGWNVHQEYFGPDPNAQVALWADNGDYGVPRDLQSIVVGTDPNDFRTTFFDRRRVFGQHGDEFFGYVFLELPGDHGTIGGLIVEGDGGSVYDANNKLVDAGVTVTGGSIDFWVVPEPLSAVLLGIGGALLAIYRRRLCVHEN